jgi:hypothetical protein
MSPPSSLAPIVIARSGSDEAILDRGMTRIAASLALLAMTTKGDNERFVCSCQA